MILRLLRLAGLIACAFVLVSFALFARDQTSSASQHQQRLLQPNYVAGSSSNPRAPHRPAQPRRAIDDVAAKLRAPFASLIHSSNAWVRRGVPTLLALLVYGLLISFLAAYARGASRPRRA